MVQENDLYRLIYVTSDTEEESINLSKLILKNNLAACANIIKGSKSFYWWNNEINESLEYIIIFKTNSKNEKQLIKKIIKNHSYENPCVISIPIINGNDAFLRWIDQETK